MPDAILFEWGTAIVVVTVLFFCALQNHRHGYRKARRNFGGVEELMLSLLTLRSELVRQPIEARPAARPASVATHKKEEEEHELVGAGPRY